MAIRDRVILPMLSAAALALMLVTSAQPAHAATFTVNSTADEPDAAPGDAICGTSSGTCTLRAAVREANASDGPHTIIFPTHAYTLVSAADEDGVSVVRLRQRSDVTISTLANDDEAVKTANVTIERDSDGDILIKTRNVTIRRDSDGDSLVKTPGVRIEHDSDGDSVIKTGSVTIRHESDGDSLIKTPGVRIERDSDGDSLIKTRNVTIRRP